MLKKKKKNLNFVQFFDDFYENFQNKKPLYIQ